MHYGRVVIEEEENIEFPANESPMMNDWMRAVLQAAAEEQLHGISAIPHRKRCRRGCQKFETAYHVAAACPTKSYI